MINDDPLGLGVGLKQRIGIERERERERMQRKNGFGRISTFRVILDIKDSGLKLPAMIESSQL